jgi:imidazolonepropionase-like amidohydrolase
MRMPRDAGTIEAGKRADMILVNADPTASVDNIWRQSGVIVRGKWLEKAELTRRLEASLGN